MTKFQAMMEFIHAFCPLPNHWCNGQPIKIQATIKYPPCQYYITDKGCMHPENPKNKIKRANNFDGGLQTVPGRRGARE